MTDAERIYRFLLVEDYPLDVKHTVDAWRPYPVQIDVVTNGADAYPAALEKRPDLILLDINLPRLRGDQVLLQLKADPLTRAIPVIMLTSSTNPLDAQRAYDLYAASFVTKPATPAAMRELAADWADWWLKRVLLPSR